jgi:hypothetical protein
MLVPSIHLMNYKTISSLHFLYVYSLYYLCVCQPEFLENKVPRKHTVYIPFLLRPSIYIMYSKN